MRRSVALLVPLILVVIFGVMALAIKTSGVSTVGVIALAARSDSGTPLNTFSSTTASPINQTASQNLQTDQTISQKLQAECEALFHGESQNSTPGFALLVKKDGQVIFEKGFGVRDLRNNIKIDARTNFRLASFTKQFTAMAIMLLVHDGKLRYEDSLTQIFPDFPAYGENITVRNLLNHTGGLTDYEDLMDAAEKTKGKIWSPEKQITDAEVLQLLEKESRAKFVPGARWDYSNSGYVVLGLVVAARSGKPFGEFLHERIFAPLKMDHTLVSEKGKNEISNRAYGHSKKEAGQRTEGAREQQNALQQNAPRGNRLQQDSLQQGSSRQKGAQQDTSQQNAFVETDQSSTSATQGDGGIYSNLEDLSKWDDALRNHTLLSEKEFAPAITPAKLPPGTETKLAEDVPVSLRGKANAYGFGWFLNLQDPHPLIWHYGDTMGFKTAVLRYTRDNVTVILLCNRTDLDQGALALKAATLVLRTE